MSYDIRFAVKDERGKYIDVFEPDLPHPTYNIGNMFRAAMGWDFKQGEYYRVSEIIDHLFQGIEELTIHSAKYRQYNAPNGWGSTSGALECLQSVITCLREHVEDAYDGNDYSLEYLYMRW